MYKIKKKRLDLHCCYNSTSHGWRVAHVELFVVPNCDNVDQGALCHRFIPCLKTKNCQWHFRLSPEPSPSPAIRSL